MKMSWIAKSLLDMGVHKSEDSFDLQFGFRPFCYIKNKYINDMESVKKREHVLVHKIT